MYNRLTNRLLIKPFIHHALGCLERYGYRGFTRYGETVQLILKMLRQVTLVNFIAQNWDLYGKKEKNELYSLASMTILKFRTEKLNFDHLILTSLWLVLVFRQIGLSSRNALDLWRYIFYYKGFLHDFLYYCLSLGCER